MHNYRERKYISVKLYFLFCMWKGPKFIHAENKSYIKRWVSIFFFFLYPKHIGTSWKNYRVFFFKLETLLSFIISWRSGTGLVIFTETPSNDKHVIFFSTKWLQYVAEYLLFVNMFTTDFKILFSIYTYTYM